jgi:hypothetical protein
MVLIATSINLSASKYPELKNFILTNPANPSQINPGALKYFFTSVVLNPFFIVGMLLLIFISIIYTLGFYSTVFNAAENGDTSFRENLKYAWKNFLPYFGVTLVASLIILAGIILFVVPGLVFIVWLSMFPALFIIGNNHKVNVLKESKKLVEGSFWPVSWRLFIIFILTQLVSYILKNDYSSPFIGFIFNLLNVVYSLIIPAFMAAYIYFIYKDLIDAKK